MEEEEEEEKEEEEEEEEEEEALSSQKAKWQYFRGSKQSSDQQRFDPATFESVEDDDSVVTQAE